MADGEIKSSLLECSVKCTPNPISRLIHHIDRCLNESGIPGRSQAQVGNFGSQKYVSGIKSLKM